MSSPITEVQEALFLASGNLLRFALLTRQQSLGFEDDPQASDDDDDAVEADPFGDTMDESTLDANFLQQISTDTIIFAYLLSDSDNKRGPYNQIQKCADYFKVSLSWPDREFRHEFRYGVSLICDGVSAE